MPSMTHEALVELFRECPNLALRLLSKQIDLPAHAQVRVEAAAVADIDPAEYRADVVLTMADDRGAPVEVIVLEVQLDIDPGKHISWPFYVAGLRARHRCPVTLVVIALDERVAAWCEQTIDLGHGRCKLWPVVIGPSRVPVITELEEACKMPELAVLSAAAHGRDPGAEHIGRAALAAVQEHERELLYGDLVYFFLDRVARQALEAIMGAFKYEYQSDFAKKYFAEGEARGFAAGEAAGEAQGLAEALLMLLDTRDLALPDELRARVLACEDPAQLRAWYKKALDAQHARDIFD